MHNIYCEVVSSAIMALRVHPFNRIAFLHPKNILLQRPVFLFAAAFLTDLLVILFRILKKAILNIAKLAEFYYLLLQLRPIDHRTIDLFHFYYEVSQFLVLRLLFPHPFDCLFVVLTYIPFFLPQLIILYLLIVLDNLFFHFTGTDVHLFFYLFLGKCQNISIHNNIIVLFVLFHNLVDLI